MTTTMILHDRGLRGFTPPGYDFTYVVDGGVPLANALHMVRANGLTRPIDSLHIFCHGREMRADMGRGMSTTEPLGGFGLALCEEGLTLETVARTHLWRGLVRQIVLFACAPAETAGGNAGTIGDGRRFCGELSLWTQAEVIAARDAQRYSYIVENFWTRHVFGGGPINFGAWEGPVFRFSPMHPEGEAYVARPHTPDRPGMY